MAKSPSKPRAATGTTSKRVAAKAGTRSGGKSPPTTAAAVVKTQMPGWQIAKGTAVQDTYLRMSDMRSESGPSIEQLRRKFLEPQDASAEGPTLGDVDEGIRTVRVRPKDGGPAKTADIRNGKISIVQG